jgi:chromate transport protein ChrA
MDIIFYIATTIAITLASIIVAVILMMLIGKYDKIEDEGFYD